MKRIIVMTGPGKGKTTSGFGMLLRALGHQMPALVVQFIKDRHSGELDLLDQLGVPLLRGGLGFVPAASHPRYAEHRAAAEQLHAQTLERLKTLGPAFVLLDEACTAAERGLLSDAQLLELVEQAAPDSILVFTGRGAPQALRDRADTVTSLTSEKHALDGGISGQAGVEF